MVSDRAKRILDLTQPLHHNCPGWPDYELPRFELRFNTATHGFNAEWIALMTHTATHVDVPYHFYAQGATIEQVPIDRFIADAVPVDLWSKHPDDAITDEDLEPYTDRVRSGDVVLLGTGWSARRGFTREYVYQWPYLSARGAEWLRDRGVKGVGIDGLSVGGWGSPEKGRPPHEVLLSAGIWLVEELNITRELYALERWRIYCLPMLLSGCGGAPARVVVVEP